MEGEAAACVVGHASGWLVLRKDPSDGSWRYIYSILTSRPRAAVAGQPVSNWQRTSRAPVTSALYMSVLSAQRPAQIAMTAFARYSKPFMVPLGDDLQGQI
jgi:hypothetical protein